MILFLAYFAAIAAAFIGAAASTFVIFAVAGTLILGDGGLDENNNI